MKLLPLGSVIKVHDQKAFIIGYNSAEKEGATALGYFIAVYPIGFTSLEKTWFIPHDYEFEVISEGYTNEAFEKVVTNMTKTFETLMNVPTEDLLKVRDALKQAAEKKKEGNNA